MTQAVEKWAAAALFLMGAVPLALGLARHGGASPAPIPAPAQAEPAPPALFIHASVPRLLQELHGGDDVPGWIDLRDEKTGKLFQRIDYPEEAGRVWPARALDLNGDGYNDLLFLGESCATNAYYHAWIYKPRRKRFVHLPGFEEIPNPEPEGRVIMSWYHVSSESGIETRHRWRKGRLVMTKMTRIGPDFDPE